MTRHDIRLGEDMGRRSRIGLEAEVTGSAMRAVRILGHAVRVAQGQIYRPD